jgi:PDDEXK-like domain of unknown function (DUF3799)
MINYSNIERHDNLPFNEYLKLGGYSFSFLKREINGINPELEITDNIRLGSMVDSILTEPHKVDMNAKNYKAAKDIATKIKAQFGCFMDVFEKQVSFTGIAEYQGFHMKTTGRLDYLLRDYAVIDLKVTQSKNVHELIKFMHYENQMWNYCKLAKVKVAYLMIHSVPLGKTQLIEIDCSSDYNEFWSDKVVKFGKVNPYSLVA